MSLKIDITKLLNRDEVELDSENISQKINGKTVLITGAGGSIGSELSRQVIKYGPSKLILLGHGENSIYEIDMELREIDYERTIDIVTEIADVQDHTRINQIFACHTPNIVFHAAAHKHVPLMEKNPGEAIKNNVFGTMNVAQASHCYGVTSFVMVSSDKAVNPTNVMGATKRMAEMFIQGMNSFSKTNFVAVRFGNVLGSRGSVVPRFERQIEKGGPITVTHEEMTRYFMTIPEAASLVIQAGAIANGGEIFILDMGKPVKIVQLARQMIMLSGKDMNEIPIVFTGLRPGEKMYEELLMNDEITEDTSHKKIFIGNQSNVNFHQYLEELVKLSKLVIDGKDLRHAISMIVPSYTIASHDKKAGVQ